MGFAQGDVNGGWAVIERSLPFQALVVAFYLGSNISLNMLNKWTLSLYGFRFPMLLSIAHMSFSFLTLAPFMATKTFRGLHAATFENQWIGLVAISTLFAMNVGLNNLSLLMIPLSLNQVIRACIPVVCAVGSVFIEQKPPSRDEFVALAVLVTGVGIAVWEGSVSGISVWGTFLCICGTVSNGLMMSSIGWLLSEKLDVIRLTFYTAPLTCVILVPFFSSMEAADFKHYQAEQTSAGYVGLVLLGCINALAYNMVHSYVIKITSSVTTTVIGEMKIVFILLLSALLLGESKIWSWQMVVGCTIAILGFCFYSHARLATSSKVQQPVVKGMPQLSSSLNDMKQGLMKGTSGQ